MTRLALLAGLPLALVLALLTVTATLLGSSAPASLAATTDIPAAYLTLYEQAATVCPGLSWTVLAGVGKVESDHGRNTATSTAGATGPMQLLPATLAAYGVDGDRDGLISATDPADAVATATAYLCSLGAGLGAQLLREALFGYNHDPAYVTTVLGWAARYGTVTLPVASGPPAATIPADASSAARAALTFALSPPVYGSAYLYGGTGPLYDCSGLVQAAYAGAGIILPRTSQQQWLAGYPTVPGDQLQAGDLVFFNPDAAGLPDHVGIYLSDGYMVDDPHTGATERLEPIAGFGVYLGATRPSP